MSSRTNRPTEAFVGSNLFEDGMGQVVVSRFKSGNRVECGVFLVDVACLGVKDAFYTELTESVYASDLLARLRARSPNGIEPMEPACARKLVEDAVAYARRLGLPPHQDYKLAARVFGGIDPSACTRTFTFGKDGQPFFFQGPHDSPEKCARILNLLDLHCGRGKYHYLVVNDVMQEMLDRGLWH